MLAIVALMIFPLLSIVVGGIVHSPGATSYKDIEVIATSSRPMSKRDIEKYADLSFGCAAIRPRFAAGFAS
jgi:hypothetical protein